MRASIEVEGRNVETHRPMARAQLSQGLIKMALPLISPIKVDRQNTAGRVLAFQVRVFG
jgi:hypothetical protein